ncbi:MAG: hypothetical protein LBT40_16650 [Deltaproteobacteria bacterium]|jgi:hypothetical protein|nr:hypothetical protein [Deltaproteobacteria bacterium]
MGLFSCSWQNPVNGRGDPALELNEAGDFAGAEAKGLEALENLALSPEQGAPDRERALPLPDSLGRTQFMAGSLAEAFPYL